MELYRNNLGNRGDGEGKNSDYPRSAETDPFRIGDFVAIDLTQPLSPEAPTWNGSCGFCLEVKKDYDRIFRVQQIKMHAGVGTHMDAPSHQFPGAMSIAQIPVQQLIVPGCVIDVSKKAGPDYSVTPEDIEVYESAYGKIPNGALVIVYTGWSRFFSDPIQYRNVDAAGQMRFPSISGRAALLLVERDVAGVAIDTLSPDCSEEEFPVHRAFLGAGKYIIENIGDCSLLPPKGAYIIALPLRAEEGTESPIRMVALVSKK